jgi:glucose-1-phosphate cytidylyltransferase
MKVVLFCGGFGTRLKDYSETTPKPLVNIGYRPILWHVMKYYAHHGHKDFVLCLGYKADAIKNYFLNYNECLTNDFILADGGKNVTLLKSDIQDWRITFVDTGTTSNIGQRLKAVEEHLDGEEMFLANYVDGLTDLPLLSYIDNFLQRDKIASFVCVKPTQSFHVVSLDGGDLVSDIQHVTSSGLWINGGYFIFRKQIFDYLREGEELVVEPFQRLIACKKLMGYRYEGFWACMDTFKEKQQLEDLYTRGDAPWEVWKSTETHKTEAHKTESLHV